MEDHHPPATLEPREPTLEDLRDLCRELNNRHAKYIEIGGFAMRAADFLRATGRSKDAPDLLFLREWFARRGETPPSV